MARTPLVTDPPPNRAGNRSAADRSAGNRSAADTIRAADLRARLAEVSLRDELRLGRRLDGLRRPGQGNARALAAVAADIARAEERLSMRRGAMPTISYPPGLPVSERRDDLLVAIADHQVVVVSGETGSGKTTQLPKLCLELGRGVRGTIGHTQPRRIAARAVAERVAEELGTELGATVGYTVRFTDQVSDTTLIKLMTDGILLAEIQRDRMLWQYDTIIIDEAHERSLNIDFLLGYLQQVLPRRPDLKLIITSATIDPHPFARYFGNAPVVEVSGRSYPVELRYHPIVDPDDPDQGERDQVTAICDAVEELRREPAGDVLVFLSGEREIRDTADALIQLAQPDTEVLPLYARLSTAEQHRVFGTHRGRRIVLATNVAETSLTVPGIKYVIDAGTARISRYSQRTKVQLLPIEAVSQASAKQRAGRCGRTSKGICIRLYTESDYLDRPKFTDPEILRTNLASVILQMTALDLGPVEEFGFIDPPDRRQIADGIALLSELGALEVDHRAPRLTDVGRRLAQLPVDPRLGRMIIEAERRGCLRDVLILTAALTIQDPRERPVEAQQAADALHARFTDPASDFAGYLNLWRHVREKQKSLSSSQFRRMCRTEYLNYPRIREWQDLFTQLRQIVKGMGLLVGDEPGVTEQIHRSVLAGLLSHIGLRERPRGDYLGARGARFAIFPGSALFKKQPSYVMAAELVETSRLWARVAAAIDPEWAEELGAHLVKRSHSEPHWERRRGAAVAVERVSLYGVPLVVGRKVDLAGVDPALSRELFIRHGLVEGDWDSRHAFFTNNRALVAEVGELESRARRRDLLVDDETVFAFYDERLPAHIVSARHFDAWWKKARRASPNVLDLTVADLVRHEASAVMAGEFPDTWTFGSFDLDLSYLFEPGSHSDGVTVTIPLPVLPEAATAGLDWQVPGLRAELVTALLRGLPKPLRRNLVPIPDTAAQLVARLPAELSGSAASLTEILAAELRLTWGIVVSADAWDFERLPGHLRPTYRIVDEHGRLLREGKDLAALQREFAGAVVSTLQRVTEDVARDRVADWDFPELPRTVERMAGGHAMTGYPALVDEAGTVAIRVLDTRRRQQAAMWAGTRRLLANTLPSPVKQLRGGLSQGARLAFTRAPHGSVDELLLDCVLAAVDSLMRNAGQPPWDRDGFQRLRDHVRDGLFATAQRAVRTVEEILLEAQRVEIGITGLTQPVMRQVRQDEASHLAELVYPGFVTATDSNQLRQLPRYLKAMRCRLDDAPTNSIRDAERQAVVDLVRRDLAELMSRSPDAEPTALARIRWMIEELRVSVFAQHLKTAYPISVTRIHAAMDALDPR